MKQVLPEEVHSRITSRTTMTEEDSTLFAQVSLTLLGIERRSPSSTGPSRASRVRYSRSPTQVGWSCSYCKRSRLAAVPGLRSEYSRAKHATGSPFLGGTLVQVPSLGYFPFVRQKEPSVASVHKPAVHRERPNKGYEPMKQPVSRVVVVNFGDYGVRKVVGGWTTNNTLLHS